MHKRDRILLFILATALAATVLLTYYQTIVKKHFTATDIEDTADESAE